MTRPCYLDTALNRIRALSQVVDLEVVLEITPSSWSQSFFDLPKRPMLPGFLPAEPLLKTALPRDVWSCWANVRSFEVLAYSSRRTYAPSGVREARRAAAVLAQRDVDVVHFDDSGRMSLGWRGHPRAVTVKNVHDPVPHPGSAGWRKKMTRHCAYRGDARIMVHAEHFRSQYARTQCVPLEAVESCLLGECEVLRSWPALPYQSGPMALLPGRMTDYKGIEVLCAAADAIATQVPGIAIVVAGPPSPGYLVPHSRALPKGGRLTVLAEHISTARLRGLMEAATVVVVPYTSATQSGVVLNAVALGIPLVASRVGALPEYIEPSGCGLLVEPGNADALASAVVSVMLSPAMRKVLRAGASSARTGPLSWAKLAQDHVAFYQRSLVRRPSCGPFLRATSM